MTAIPRATPPMSTFGFPLTGSEWTLRSALISWKDAVAPKAGEPGRLSGETCRYHFEVAFEGEVPMLTTKPHPRVGSVYGYRPEHRPLTVEDRQALVVELTKARDDVRAQRTDPERREQNAAMGRFWDSLESTFEGQAKEGSLPAGVNRRVQGQISKAQGDHARQTGQAYLVEREQVLQTWIDRLGG